MYINFNLRTLCVHPSAFLHKLLFSHRINLKQRKLNLPRELIIVFFLMHQHTDELSVNVFKNCKKCNPKKKEKQKR